MFDWGLNVVFFGSEKLAGNWQMDRILIVLKTYGIGTTCIIYHIIQTLVYIAI